MAVTPVIQKQIIFHLFIKCTTYLASVKQEKQTMYIVYA